MAVIEADGLYKIFGDHPEEARRLAAGQTCRDEISEETEDILQQIGVLASE